MNGLLYWFGFLLLLALAIPFAMPLGALYGAYCEKVWNWMEARL